MDLENFDNHGYYTRTRRWDRHILKQKKRRTNSRDQQHRHIQNLIATTITDCRKSQNRTKIDRNSK